MNSINRLLTAIKSLFSKRGNNVEGNETQAEVLPATNQSPDSAVIQPEPGSAVSTVAPAEAAAPVVDAAAGNETAQPAPSAPAVNSNEPVVLNADSSTVSAGLLTDVKILLMVAGHDVEAVWDDAVEYAKKAAQDLPLVSDLLAEKLESVLRVAGHDVGDIISDAFSFARKHGKS